MRPAHGGLTGMGGFTGMVAFDDNGFLDFALCEGSIQNIQGCCETAMFGPKNTMFILKILILPVYNLT